MDPDKIFYCEKKFCRVICKDGETVSGIVRMVSYQGDDDPDENFIMIGPYGILFDDIDSIEETPDPSEPEILIDELWRSYDDRKRVDEIFDRLDSFLKEDHPEDEKKIITDFYDRHVLSESDLTDEEFKEELKELSQSEDSKTRL